MLLETLMACDLLFIAKNDTQFFGFASIMKQLVKLDNSIDVSQFPPGNYMEFKGKYGEDKANYLPGPFIPFSSVNHISIDTTINTEQRALQRIRASLLNTLLKNVFIILKEILLVYYQVV